MTDTRYTFNRYHLGDNLIFLHLLRALAKQGGYFVHFCHQHLIDQLAEAVQDIENIALFPFENPLWNEVSGRAVDTWKNADGHWERSPNRWKWATHALEHHAWTAKRMGMESPFTRREHLLLDYPALSVGPSGIKFDFFVCNSEPCSGQFGPMRQHDSGYLDGLVRALVSSGKSVMVTKPIGGFTSEDESMRCFQPGTVERTSIGKYGYYSTLATHHIMIATGPMWPTLNTTNHHHHEGRKRIVLLDNGEVLGMPHIDQASNVEEVMEIAKEGKWL